MKKLIIIGVILAIFLISGCAKQIVCNKPYILVGSECCLDKDDNKICDKEEVKEEIIQTQEAQAESTQDKIEIVPVSNMIKKEVNEIIDEIQSITKKTYSFELDKSISNEKVNYYYSNLMRHFIIEEIKNEEDYINSYQDFCEYTLSNGFEFFGDDKGILINFTTDLDKSSFKKNEDYASFKGGRKNYIFSYNTKEHKFDEGKIIEFYNSLDIYDSSQGFINGRINYMLKVYCGPNLIIKIRPQKSYYTDFSGQKIETAFKNTESMISEMRTEIMPQAKTLLKVCSVDQSFFNDFSIDENKYSLSYYYYPEISSELKKSDAPEKIKDLFIFTNYNLKKISEITASSSDNSGGYWWW